MIKEEYIKRSALLDSYRYGEYNDVAELIEEFPAADVEPVVRGEWKEFDADMNVYVCSVCDEPYVLIDGTPEQNHYNYCPNCGAHMTKKDGE